MTAGGVTLIMFLPERSIVPVCTGLHRYTVPEIRSGPLDGTSAFETPQVGT